MILATTVLICFCKFVTVVFDNKIEKKSVSDCEILHADIELNIIKLIIIFYI